MKKLVIVPGGYHPYHAGHRALFNAARERFPSAEIYVAATDDVSDRPFPFRIKKFLAQQAGIPGNRFMQVKSPFSAEEITQHFDPNETQLIFVRSDKDRNQNPQPGSADQIVTRGARKGQAPYLQLYRRNGLQPMKDHAYIIYLRTELFGPGMSSATEVRAKWPGMSEEEKTSLVTEMYPLADTDAKVAKIVEILDTILGKKPITEELFNKQSDYIRMSTGQFIYVDYRTTAQNLNPMDPHITHVEMRWVPDHEAKALGLEKKVQDTSRRMNGTNVFNLDSDLVPKGVKKKIEQWIKTNPAPTNSATPATTEARLVNDPDAGHQIIPDGGMGTWNEASIVSRLAEKFKGMVDLVKDKNYVNLQYVLYRNPVVKSLVDALAEYERFMEKQGRRPIAKGREINMGIPPVNENPDYVNEGKMK